jgi:hypothetical protein
MYYNFINYHPDRILSDLEKDQILAIFINERKNFVAEIIAESLHLVRIEDLASKSFAADVGLSLREIVLDSALDDYKEWIEDHSQSAVYAQEKKDNYLEQVLELAWARG